MKDSQLKRARDQAMLFGRQFLSSGTGLFAEAIGQHELVLAVSTQIGSYRERLYPPLDTLRLFVGQVLSTDRACQDVVSRRLSERVAQGEPVSSLNTSAYCEARQRLPIGLPQALGTALAERLEARAPVNWHWQGRSNCLTAPPSPCRTRPVISRLIRKHANKSPGWDSPWHV